jgi:hypothetical protein
MSWKLWPQDDPESPHWRPYAGASCRICGREFSRSEFVRLHIRDAHCEALPPSPTEYYNGATWTRKTPPAGPNISTATPSGQPESLREMLESQYLDGQPTK